MRVWEGHLGTSLGGGLEGRFWVNSEVILGPFSGPYLKKPHEYLRIAFIWPWVGYLKSNILNMGPWDGTGLGTGIAPPHPPTVPTTPGTPPPYLWLGVTAARSGCRTKYGRGAQIRRPTHLRPVILRVQGYDRGI